MSSTTRSPAHRSRRAAAIAHGGHRPKRVRRRARSRFKIALEWRMLRAWPPRTPAQFRSSIFVARAWCCSGTCSGGTWTAYDVPPSLVHGVALIRSAQPNICVYGHGGRLRLQVGTEPIRAVRELAAHQVHAGAWRVLAFAGASRSNPEHRRHVCSATRYWTNQGEDFFRWLAARAQDPDWRVARRAAMVGRRACGRAALGLSRLGDARQQPGDLGFRQIAPLTQPQGAELNTDDAHALQSLRPVAERRAHAADLPIEPLSEDHAKRFRHRCASLCRAWSSHP